MHIFSSVMFTLAPGTVQSVAVTRMDDFMRGGNLPSLTDRFSWRVSQSQPAAAHRCRYASDICSSRSSSMKSKTLPVGFHKKPDSWIISGGFSVTMSYTTLSFLLEALDQSASDFLSTTAKQSELQQCCKLQGSKDWRKEQEFGSNWKKETHELNKKDSGAPWMFTFRSKPKASPDKT